MYPAWSQDEDDEPLVKGVDRWFRVISITDVTKVGREIVAKAFSPCETWLIVAAMYFAMTFSLSILGRKIENSMKQKGGM